MENSMLVEVKMEHFVYGKILSEKHLAYGNMSMVMKKKLNLVNITKLI